MFFAEWTWWGMGGSLPISPDVFGCFFFFLIWSNLRLGHDALIDLMVGSQETEAACFLFQTNHRMKLRSLDIIMIYNDLWRNKVNFQSFSDTNFPDGWNSLSPTSGSFKAGLRWRPGTKQPGCWTPAFKLSSWLKHVCYDSYIPYILLNFTHFSFKFCSSDLHFQTDFSGTHITLI